MKLTPSFLSRS